MKFALIGKTIAHSLSPTVYAELFSKRNINGSFSLFTLSCDELLSIRDIVKENSLDAFAVTMPYKQSILNYIDRLDESAKKTESVNFVTVKNGIFTGYSTDGAGFVASAKEQRISFSGKKVMLYGSGGAAKSLAASLSRETNKLYIASRNKRERDSLSNRFGMHCALFPADITGTDIFINATPLGMQGHDDFPTFDFLKEMNKDAVVFDLVYMPKETNLFYHAQQMNITVYNGIPMLYAQAKLALNYYLSE